MMIIKLAHNKPIHYNNSNHRESGRKAGPTLALQRALPLMIQEMKKQKTSTSTPIEKRSKPQLHKSRMTVLCTY